MKLAVLILFLCSSLLFPSGVLAQPSKEASQRQLAEFEAERDAIRRESFQLAGGQTVAQSLVITSANKSAIDQQIRLLEPRIEQVAGTRNELMRDRDAMKANSIFAKDDAAQESIEHEAEELALAGASTAAHRVAGWAGFVIDVVEYGDRYRIKYNNLSQLDQIITQHHANLSELYDAAKLLYHAQSIERNKLKRLEQLDQRDRELWGEIAVLKDRLKSRPTGRDTDAAGDEALRATARREAMRVGPSDPNTVLPGELAGFWTVSGYNCEGPEIDEFVDIAYSPEEGLVATKAMGDNCIHSGEVTWRGKIEGKTIRVRMHVRAPKAADDADSWMEGTLEIVSRNEIRGLGMVMHR